MIQLQHITHQYLTGASTQAILHNVCLSIPVGQSCALVGASGSGKSTLLSLIGLLDEPTQGRVLLHGMDLTGASPNRRAMMRNQFIGFVFQSFNLLPHLDALDNVALPLLYRGLSRQTAREAARIQLKQLGLEQRGHHLPADLSGGQRQRVAIARALIGKPALLLADEPTGNLDSQTADDIMTLLLSLNKEHRTTLIVVTHDSTVSSRMARCLHMRDGQVYED